MKSVIKLSERKLHDIISETILNHLNESDITNKTCSLNKLLPLIKKNGGKWIEREESLNQDAGNFVFFMNSEDMSSDKFKKIESALKIGGYTVSNVGGYYDDRRLRSYIEDAVDNNLFGENSSPYNIYAVMIEPMYAKKADERYIKGELNDYDYPYLYKSGIFYHVTLRKFLSKIMKYGLIPKNGNTITRSRNTNDRVYLSTVPDFNVEYSFPSDEEMYDDDMILLMVDLNKLNKKIKLHQDLKYANAVYTTENIPPQCIEEVNTDILQLYEMIRGKYHTIVKHNAKSYGFSLTNIMRIFKTDKKIRKEVADKLYKLTYDNIKGKERFFKDTDIWKCINDVIDSEM